MNPTLDNPFEITLPGLVPIALGVGGDGAWHFRHRTPWTEWSPVLGAASLAAIVHTLERRREDREGVNDAATEVAKNLAMAAAHLRLADNAETAFREYMERHRGIRPELLVDWHEGGVLSLERTPEAGLATEEVAAAFAPGPCPGPAGSAVEQCDGCLDEAQGLEPVRLDDPPMSVFGDGTAAAPLRVVERPPEPSPGIPLHYRYRAEGTEEWKTGSWTIVPELPLGAVYQLQVCTGADFSNPHPVLDRPLDPLPEVGPGDRLDVDYLNSVLRRINFLERRVVELEGERLIPGPVGAKGDKGRQGGQGRARPGGRPGGQGRARPGGRQRGAVERHGAPG